MIVCLSFCENDRAMALELARHIECLGGCKKHRCIVFHPKGVESHEIADRLRNSFAEMEVISYPARLHGWPDGPNQAFFEASEAVFHKYPKEEWLWMEADCVPTRKSWLDDISGEYRFCGQPILGALSATFDGHGKIVGEHVTGVAVYPGDFLSKCPPLRSIVTTTEHYRKSGGLPPAFDVYLAAYTVPRCAKTQTIRHYWKAFEFTEAMDGEIRCKYQKPHGVSNLVDMDAALIHGCKDFTLLNLVQRRLSNVLTQRIPEIMKENACS